jgi:hypothetical protein
MTTWRITVTGGEPEEREAFKDAHYKQLLTTTGDSVSFELPEADAAGADALVAEAKKAGLEASKESYEDPLDSADAAVDFW